MTTAESQGRRPERSNASRRPAPRRDRPRTANAAEGLRFVRLELRLIASPERVYAAWSDPERLHRWFPQEIKGSLAPGTRSTLLWPDRSVWWDVEEANPPRLFVFRWPWLPDGSYATRVTVRIVPEGYGARVTLEDGPFDLSVPGVLDAWAEANAGWGQALAHLKGFVDYSVDLRR